MTPSGASPAIGSAVGRVSPGRLAAKQRLYQLLQLLRPRIAAAVAETPDGVTPRVVHVGATDAGWAGLCTGLQAQLVAFCADPDAVDGIRRQVPDYDLRAARSGYTSLELEPEVADVVATTHVMTGRASPERRAVLTELLRVLGVGGSLVLLETFVDDPDGDEPEHQRLAAFLEQVVLASGGCVFVERLRSIRYPGEDLRRGGLLTLLKTGAPQRW